MGLYYNLKSGIVMPVTFILLFKIAYIILVIFYFQNEIYDFFHFCKELH